MLAYFFDVVGYLTGSGLLNDFFVLVAVCCVILIVRQLFMGGE